MRYPALDGLRGVMAVLIVLGHSAFCLAEPTRLLGSTMFLVEVFFVISGFLIGATIDRAGTAPSDGFAAFMWRRLDRLYPLFLVALLAWVPFVALRWLVWQQTGMGSDPLERHTFEQFVVHVFLLQSVFGDFRAAWNYPDWYVSAVVISCAALYVFALLTARVRNAGLPVLAAVICYAAMYRYAPDHHLIRFNDFGFLRGIAASLMGLALYRITRDGVKVSLGPVSGTLLEVAVLAACSWVLLDARTGDPLREYAVVPVLCLAVFVFVQQGAGLVTRLLSTPPLVALGVWSYAVYLFHGLFLVLAFNVAHYLLGVRLQHVDGFDDGAGKMAIVGSWTPLINVVLIVAIVAMSAWIHRHLEPRANRLWLQWRQRMSA